MNVNKILCCLCGVQIFANNAAMCIECLRSQFDVTEGIAKDCEIVQCRKCDRWNVSKDHWTNMELESSNLLSACLRRIHGLQQVRLIDAKWIWTEPHSKRLKVLLEVEGEVLDNRITLRQSATVEFVIKNKQCLNCIRDATDHTWGALVQLRQRIRHKTALLALENSLVKSGLRNTMIDVQLVRDGLDIYFRAKNHADRVVEFISSMVPTKVKATKKLISKDLHSNVGRYEHTINVEIAPLSKGDLVVVSKSHNNNSAGDLMLVMKLSSNLHLMSPLTLNHIELSNVKYFAKPLVPLLSLHHLITFVVLDVTPIQRNPRASSKKSEGGGAAVAAMAEAMAGKFAWCLLAEVEVARESDFGDNDTTYRVITHLGRVLQAGDTVMGYDLSHTLHDEESLEGLPFDRPDIILVRKTYPEEAKKKKKSNRPMPHRRKQKGAAGAAALNSLVEDELGEVSTEDIALDLTDPLVAATATATEAESEVNTTATIRSLAVSAEEEDEEDEEDFEDEEDERLFVDSAEDEDGGDEARNIERIFMDDDAFEEELRRLGLESEQPTTLLVADEGEVEEEDLEDGLYEEDGEN